MGTANTKSTIITNSDYEATAGTPNIMNSLLLNGGVLHEKAALCAKLAADGNASVYRFVRLSSSDRVSSLQIITDAISGMTAADVGLYDTAANGGAVVSQHLFATGLDLHLGNTTPVEARWNNLAAASAEQAIWQLLSLASDPVKGYDLCITLTTAGGSAGNLAMQVRYSAGLT